MERMNQNDDLFQSDAEIAWLELTEIAAEIARVASEVETDFWLPLRYANYSIPTGMWRFTE